MDGNITRLNELFALQKRALVDKSIPSLAERLSRLKRLKHMLVENRERFRKALAADFGNHHPWMSDMLEGGAVLGRIRAFEAELPKWLERRPVQLEEAHGASHAEIMIVPKGVNGIIAPWNFPIECALGMLTDIFAAGNSAIIKPSELAPACAKALEEAVDEAFPSEVLAAVLGGPEFSHKFASMPWDHLTYTGSTRVGRLVAEAAARNLTPVTLELGGKNPALFAADAIDEQMIATFLSFRALKAGQVCTSPDYVLVPHDKVEQWVETACKEWRKAYPKYVGHADATGIINERHYARIMNIIDEARERGARVVTMNGDKPDPNLRQIPMTLIVNPPADLICMQEEIFGPVTPVVPFKTLDEAIARINAGPSPLGAYIATRDEAAGRRFAASVRCGGASVNTFGLQGNHPALPFGGFGASGHGCHSSEAGFLNYSHRKSVFYGAADSPVHQTLKMPFGPVCGYVADAMFRPDAA